MQTRTEQENRVVILFSEIASNYISQFHLDDNDMNMKYEESLKRSKRSQ